MPRFAGSWTLAGLAIATVASVAAAAAAHAQGEPSVTVFDQAAAGNAIKVHYVNLPAKGYVAVHAADGNGKPIAAPVGTAELAAGDHRDVKITLKEAPKPGQRMWVSLHQDSDNKPGFDPAVDKAVWGQALPEENAFTVR